MSLDISEIHAYRFKDEKAFRDYVSQMLRNDNSEITGDALSNMSFVMVQQQGENDLKIFPWSQILKQGSERNELVNQIVKLYKSELLSLCKADVECKIDSHTWTDDMISELPNVVSGVEDSGFYPIVMSLHNGDSNFKKCHIHMIVMH